MWFFAHVCFQKFQAAVANEVKQRVGQIIYNVKFKFQYKQYSNPLQRHYLRDQTILSFEQNLIEDTGEMKRKFLVKIKIIV